MPPTVLLGAVAYWRREEETQDRDRAVSRRFLFPPMLIFGCCIIPRDLEQSNPEAIMKGSRPGHDHVRDHLVPHFGGLGQRAAKARPMSTIHSSRIFCRVDRNACGEDRSLASMSRRIYIGEI